MQVKCITFLFQNVWKSVLGKKKIGLEKLFEKKSYMLRGLNPTCSSEGRFASISQLRLPKIL